MEGARTVGEANICCSQWQRSTALPTGLDQSKVSTFILRGTRQSALSALNTLRDMTAPLNKSTQKQNTCHLKIDNKSSGASLALFTRPKARNGRAGGEDGETQGLRRSSQRREDSC